MADQDSGSSAAPSGGNAQTAQGVGGPSAQPPPPSGGQGAAAPQKGKATPPPKGGQRGRRDSGSYEERGIIGVSAFPPEWDRLVRVNETAVNLVLQRRGSTEVAATPPSPQVAPQAAAPIPPPAPSPPPMQWLALRTQTMGAKRFEFWVGAPGDFYETGIPGLPGQVVAQHMRSGKDLVRKLQRGDKALKEEAQPMLDQWATARFQAQVASEDLLDALKSTPKDTKVLKREAPDDTWDEADENRPAISGIAPQGGKKGNKGAKSTLLGGLRSKVGPTGNQGKGKAEDTRDLQAELVKHQRRLYLWATTSMAETLRDIEDALNQHTCGEVPDLKVFHPKDFSAIDAALNAFKIEAEYWRLVMDDISVGVFHRGRYRAKAERRVESGLELMGAADWSDAPMAEVTLGSKLMKPRQDTLPDAELISLDEANVRKKDHHEGKVPKNFNLWNVRDLKLFLQFILSAVHRLDRVAQGDWILFTQPRWGDPSMANSVQSALVLAGDSHEKVIRKLGLFTKEQQGAYRTLNGKRWFSTGNEDLFKIIKACCVSSAFEIHSTLDFSEWEAELDPAVAAMEAELANLENARQPVYLPLNAGPYTPNKTYRVSGIPFFAGSLTTAQLRERVAWLQSQSEGYGIDEILGSDPFTVRDDLGQEAVLELHSPRVTADPEQRDPTPAILATPSSTQHAFLATLSRMARRGPAQAIVGDNDAATEVPKVPSYKEWHEHSPFLAHLPNILLSSGLIEAIQGLPTARLGTSQVPVKRLERDIIRPVGQLGSALQRARALVKGLPPSDPAVAFDATLSQMETEYERTLLPDHYYAIFARLAQESLDVETADAEAMAHISQMHDKLEEAIKTYKAALDLSELLKYEPGNTPSDLRTMQEGDDEAYEKLNDAVERFICAVRDDVAAADTLYNAFLGYKNRFAQGYRAVANRPVPQDAAAAQPSATRKLMSKLGKSGTGDVTTIGGALGNLETLSDTRQANIQTLTDTLQLVPSVEIELERVSTLPILSRMGLPAFQHHVIEHKSSENANFLMDTAESHSNLWIYKTYIDTTATREINISSGLRGQIIQTFTKMMEDLKSQEEYARTQAKLFLAGQDRAPFETAIQATTALLNQHWLTFQKEHGKRAVINSLITRRR